MRCPLRSMRRRTIRDPRCAASRPEEREVGAVPRRGVDAAADRRTRRELLAADARARNADATQAPASTARKPWLEFVIRSEGWKRFSNRSKSDLPAERLPSTN